VEGIESPLEGLPNGYPGRTHAPVDVNVTRVVGLHRNRADLGGNDIPDIPPEELNPALGDLAATLGRPADLNLVADFAAEVLQR
jgi:hypothetical protein